MEVQDAVTTRFGGLNESVPMVPELATVLARLLDRDHHTADDEPLFPGRGGGSATLRELQEWMGHADAKTTARYTHYRPRGGEAARLAPAFAASGWQTNGLRDPAGATHPDASGRGGNACSVRESAEPGGGRVNV